VRAKRMDNAREVDGNAYERNNVSALLDSA